MARNPYQLDPFLAQGFSNLTKALIGDPETDYQVARTNRVNELLPLEKQQMQSNIAGNNASAAASNALATLREAQRLSEEELREPTTQLKIAEAKKVLADIAKVNAQTQTINDLRPSQIESERYLGQSRLADSLLNNAKTSTVNALRVPEVNSENALAAQRNAAAGADTSRGGLYDAQIKTEDGTRQGKINKLDAETAKLESEQQLNRAKTASENRIILNAGQTIRTTNKQTGKVETYTAPETVQVTLAPGEEAVVSKADGTQETFAHSQQAEPDPKNAKGRLELIDAQLAAFTEDGLFAEVPKGVMRRLQSGYTDYAEGLLRQDDGTVDEEDEEEIQNVVAMIRDQLSQTYQGQTAVTITKGSNFDVPAFIINNLMQPNATLDPKIITKTYGFSLSQAKRIINFVREQ